MNVGVVFRRLLLSQVLLGVAAFCVAGSNPGLLLVAGALAAFSWFVVEGPRGKPLPQWLLAPGALAALAWLLFDLSQQNAQVGGFDQRGRVIVPMGHFTMWLQVLLLYGRKSNREYVEILILSLMQMVAASLLSVSVGYGVLLAAYCGLMLFTLLAFQLKATGDVVAGAFRAAVPEGREAAEPPAVAGRGLRWQFRLTALGVGGVAAAVAAAVFLAVPRSGDARTRQQRAAAAAGPSRVGYSDVIDLGGPAPTLDNTQPVAHLRVIAGAGGVGAASPPGGSPPDSSSPEASVGANLGRLLLRGTTLDFYDRAERRWLRSLRGTPAERRVEGAEKGVPLAGLMPGEPVLRARITLRGSGDPTLFTLFPVASIQGPLPAMVFNSIDQTLAAGGPLGNGLEYELVAPLNPPPGFFARYTSGVPGVPGVRAVESGAGPAPKPRPGRGADDADPGVRPRSLEGLLSGARAEWRGWAGDAEDTPLPRGAADPRRGGRRGGVPEVESASGRARREAAATPRAVELPGVPPGYATGWRVRPEEVAAMASGILHDAGLGRLGGEASGPEPDGTEAAVAETGAGDGDDRDARIAGALADYLRTHFRYTLDNPGVPYSQDPVAEFLLHQRSGHCELFAAGLAALARSVGLPARLVTGFIVTEYNQVGGYHVVRQSDAHAWTEVYCGPRLGWRVFDSTPPADVEAEHRQSRTLLSGLREFYEYLEFSWLGSVVTYDQGTRQRVFEGASQWFSAARARLDGWGQRLGRSWGAWRLEDLNLFVLGLIAVGIALGLAILVQTVLSRRRRLVTLQLTALPRAERKALAKRLRFYLSMLDLLERYGHRRPTWQSPYAFAQRLAEGDPPRFEPVVALAEIFYEVRFGHRAFDDDRQRRVKAHLKRLEQNLAARSVRPRASPLPA